MTAETFWAAFAKVSLTASRREKYSKHLIVRELLLVARILTMITFWNVRNRAGAQLPISKLRCEKCETPPMSMREQRG